MTDRKLWIAIALAAIAATACSDGGYTPGAGDKLTRDRLKLISENVTEAVELPADAGLYELFCQHSLKGPCPANITEKLADFSVGDKSRVGLGESFIRLHASGGAKDAAISDEAFIRSSYLVVLGREPEAQGLADGIVFLKDGNERKATVRGMMRSPEFQNQPIVP